jgi:hypothetical protein
MVYGELSTKCEGIAKKHYLKLDAKSCKADKLVAEIEALAKKKFEKEPQEGIIYFEKGPKGKYWIGIAQSRPEERY